MNSFKMKSARQESVEALRCLLMFLIVAHHSFYWGIFGAEQAWWTNVFQGLTIWHVDAFIAISGWFGIRCKPSKIIRLIALMFWTSCLSIGYLLLFDRSHFTAKSIGIQGGWFGATYLMFMFVAPFVNAAVKWFGNESPRKLLQVWSLLAVAYGLTWIPSHLLLPFSPSGVSGQSLFLFFFIYLTMRFVKQYDDRIEFLRRPILVGGCVFLASIALCGGIAILYRWRMGLPILGRNWSAWSWYDAPHVLLFAICLVYWFATRVRVPMWLSRIVLFLSPSMFPIYLLHDTTSFGKLLYVIPEEYLWTNFQFHPCLNIMIAAVLCYALCLLVDMIRRMIIYPFRNKVNCVFLMIDRKFEEV